MPLPSRSLILNSRFFRTMEFPVFTEPEFFSKSNFNYVKSVEFIDNVIKQPKLVAVDNFEIIKKDIKGYVSPRLLNWVEPYLVNSVKKTLFYTEINSNIQVGDRVWIVNGYYDNDLLIQKNKYKKGRDGYIVLFVDKCKIVLDINYTGVLPFNDYTKKDDFIKVYRISNREEFLNVNKQISTRGGKLTYKFDRHQNNMIFIDSQESSSFSPVFTEKGDILTAANSYHIAGYGVSLGLTGSPGFFVRNGVSYWTNISKELFYYGTYSVALGTYSNNKMMIMNGDFNYKGIDFKEGFVYEWHIGPTNSHWRVDKTYSKPIIGKANFRAGEFYGIFNNGVYGTQENRIKWKGINSVWNGGTLLNTSWENGKLLSQISLADDYKSAFDTNKKPYQKANTNNNNGYGYNYLIDSHLKKSTVENGYIINTKIGELLNRTVLKNHLKSVNQIYNNIINKAYFENCDFTSIKIDNATLINSIIKDTKVTNSKVINSQIYDSVIKDSTYLSEDSIKIKAYDEWNISEYKYTNLLNNPLGTSTYSIIQLSDTGNMPNSRTTHKLFKFYIEEKDYDNLRLTKHFYLKGLKINDNSKNVLNFFDKKFKFGTWIEYIDDYTTDLISSDYILEKDSFYKRGFEYTSYLSTPQENTYILNSVTQSVDFGFLSLTSSNIEVATYSLIGQYTSLYGKNPNSKYYSIDILISIQDMLDRTNDTNINFNYDSAGVSPGTQSIYLGNKIDISKAFVINSNFESGIFETSDWTNGYNINYNNDVNISSLTGSGDLRMSIDFNNNTLIAQNTQYSLLDKKETFFNENDIIYLNSIDYINGDYVKRLPDTYEILYINGNNLILKEVNTNIISGLTAGGYFRTSGSKNRYNYISKVKFDKSRIKSGLFKRSYFNNSLIQNSNYDSNDRDYNNLEKIRNLVITDTIFSSNNNILSSATYLNSFFIGGSDIWQNGIIQNSFLNGMTFSNGIIKESRWENGTFTGGLFYNSRTFDGSPSVNQNYYFDNRIKSYYMDGPLGPTLSNNRYAWVDGEFLNGEFYKSDWENGLFKNGLFNYSKFYKGTFSGGNIGTSKNAITDTVIYNGDVTYTTVDSATFYSKDPNYSGLSSSNINWYNGVFNNGLFGSYNDEIEIFTITSTSSYIDVPYDSAASTIIASGGYFPAGITGMTINQINLNPVYTISSSLRNVTLGFLVSSINLSEADYGDIIDTSYPFEIKLKMKIRHSWIGDLVINLQSPNGQIINIKERGSAGSNWFSGAGNVIFSSNDDNPSLSQISPIYYDSESHPFFNFKMSKVITTSQQFNSIFGTYSFIPTTDNITDLLNNTTSGLKIGSDSGDWELIIIDQASGDLGLLQSWGLEFNYSTLDSSTVIKNSATWHDGTFNSGQFINYAKWKNGTFNGGKFTSAYGATASGLYLKNSNDIIDYSWETGTFNGGEFGNSNKDSNNSTWFSGTFNGGEFKGKLWNNGMFVAGNFKGSSTYSAIGDLNIQTYESNASRFVDSFSQSFYGLWVDGIVTTTKDQYIGDIKYYYENELFNSFYKVVNFDNVLWLSGTFSNESATFKNSVWLSGVFNKGTFKNSSFNPYSRRGSSVNYPLNLSNSGYSFTPNFNPPLISPVDNSVWVNGDLIESDFYMSKWFNGNFISGTAYGMVFINGISNHMNAYNVIWEGGTWKNGNWHGSDFEYSGGFFTSNGTYNNFVYNIVRRGMREYGFNTVVEPLFSASGGVLTPLPNTQRPGLNNIHIWNLFSFTNKSLITVNSNGATNISFDIFSEETSVNTFIPLEDLPIPWDDGEDWNPRDLAEWGDPPGPSDYSQYDTQVSVDWTQTNIDTNTTMPTYGRDEAVPSTPSNFDAG